MSIPQPGADGPLGLSWHYTGVRYSDFRSGRRAAHAQAYSQVDAHAGVDFGRFRFDAFVHNLTDARGIANLGFFGDVQRRFRGRRDPPAVGRRSSLGYRY